MKKSTVIIILIVYLASIVVIGFFGMKVKVYDKVKYVQSIEMSVQAEQEEMFEFISMGVDANTQNHRYKLTIYFSKYHLQDSQGNSYLPVILIPHITYDTGDVAGESESIVYKIVSNTDYEGMGKVSLSKRGELRCFDSPMVFNVFVSPEKSSLVGSSAMIEVWVV